MVASHPRRSSRGRRPGLFFRTEDAMKVLLYDVKGWAGCESLTIINPERAIVELYSRVHGQGKSSAIEPLKALAGGKASLPDGPSAVRNGHKAATAIFEWQHLGATVRAEMKVTKKGDLSIALTCDGKPVSKPREVLGQMFGRLYSPADFREWTLAQQLDFARSLAGDEWVAQAEALAALERSTAEDRTVANRACKALGRLEPVPQALAVDGAGALAKLEAARKHNAVVRVQVARREEALRSIRLAEARVDQLEEELRNAKLRVTEARCVYDLVPAAEAEIDEAPLATAIADLGEAKAARERWLRYQADLEKVEATNRAAIEAESRLEQVRVDIAKHRASCPLPDGLTMGDDGLIWRGRPLARASTGEGWALSLRLAAAAGQHLVLGDRAESVDDGIVAELDKLCVENDMAAFICTLGTPHTSGALELWNGRLMDEETAKVLNDAEVAQMLADDALDALDEPVDPDKPF
jgi:hypothetical protein